MSNTPLRIDEIEGRPVLVLERAPYRVVVVDRDRIIDPHGLRGSSNIIDVSLECELRRVHADHHQSLILVFLGPRADIGKRAQPVDAGIGPEVDEDDLAAQAGRRQRLRVEPPGRAAKRRQLTFYGQVNCGGRHLPHPGFVLG